jgi:hypothetical protein
MQIRRNVGWEWSASAGCRAPGALPSPRGSGAASPNHRATSGGSVIRHPSGPRVGRFSFRRTVHRALLKFPRRAQGPKLGLPSRAWRSFPAARVRARLAKAKNSFDLLDYWVIAVGGSPLRPGPCRPEVDFPISTLGELR